MLLDFGDNRRIHHKLRFLLFVLLIFTGSFLFSQEEVKKTPKEAAAPKRVLILNSYHHSFLWTDEVVRTIVRTISDSFPETIFNIEYMDEKRFQTKEDHELFLQYFLGKYKGVHPDVIITSDDAALVFIKKVYPALFKGIPVVFCGVNYLPNAQTAPDGFYGLIEFLDIADNLRLIKRLFPNTQNIIVVTDGTATGLGTRQEVVRVSSNFSRIRFSYLNGEDLSTGELLSSLERLPENSVVIAPAWYLDKNGTHYTNDQIYPLISRKSPVPVIITSSANIGLGPLGGKVNSGETQGEYAAKVALEFMTGKKTPSVPEIQMESQNKYLFDYRQLKRFNINPKALPENSRVLYQEFSFYETYKPLVWSVALVILIFASLSAGLALIVHRLSITRKDLADSREHLRITLNCIGDAVITTDIKGIITGMNPMAEQLTGWSMDEAKGSPLGGIFKTFKKESREPVLSPEIEVLREVKPVSNSDKIFLVSKNTEEFLISDSCAPILDSSGKLNGAVLVFRNITEEYRREEEIRHAQKMDAVGQLAGGIAHDFNNMLGGILGSSELLLKKVAGEIKLEKAVRIIINAAEQASQLTEKLLIFSRKSKITFLPVDIHKCIEDGLSILERSINKNISIKRNYSAYLNSVMGETSQIQNAVINLVINAGHAMPDGGSIIVSTKNLELDEEYCKRSSFKIEPGAYLLLSITDTGKGINPDVMPHIFEPFFTTREAGKGTGMGLSAVYGAVKEHRGEIKVHSEVGKGTTFEIYLPAVQAEEAQSGKNEEFHGKSETGTGAGTVLFVDDEELIRTVIECILKDAGYKVELASDGEEGVQCFKEKQEEIDLVLLDLVMPQMGGEECFHELRKIKPDIPIVICSGFDRNDSLRLLQESNDVKFLRKPFHSSKLIEVIHECMNNKSL